MDQNHCVACNTMQCCRLLDNLDNQCRSILTIYVAAQLG